MTSVSMDIHVHHLTRVEGHGDIVLKVEDGQVVENQWRVVEAPRFFEAMVIGQPYTALAEITSRICGICSIGHTLASLKATEAAMGIEITEQTHLLRKLALHGENLQSHILHACYLVLPDLMDAPSVVPLATTHPDEVRLVARLHRLANEMCDLVCGRTTHPITLDVGGMTKVPTADELKGLKQRLVDSVEDLKAAAALFKSLMPKMPLLDRETEYVGLVHDDEYALYDGDIATSDTGRHPVTDYLNVTNEFVVPQSTAKFTKNARDSLAVGALARFNLNHDTLTPLAAAVAQDLGLVAPCTNPFMNSIAQLVECVWSVEDSIALTDKLLEMGVQDETYEVAVKAGQGIGGVEVPRGILFHDYTYDENGYCIKDNCIIPTNQNHNNIQKDFEAYVPQLLAEGKSEEEITQLLKMLVRSYDPCISCSTH